MTTIPKLITAKSFVIEQVARESDMNCGFIVTLRLADDERRKFVVLHDALLNFDKFSEAALAGANVLLRHPAEERTPLGRIAWLELLSEAIERSTSKEQRPQAGRG